MRSGHTENIQSTRCRHFNCSLQYFCGVLDGSHEKRNSGVSRPSEAGCIAELLKREINFCNLSLRSEKGAAFFAERPSWVQPS